MNQTVTNLQRCKPASSLVFLALFLLSMVIPSCALAVASEDVALILENSHVKYVIGSNAKNLRFVDKQTGIDYCRQNLATSVARIRIGGKNYEATGVTADAGRITLAFGDSGASAVLRVHTFQSYFVVEVLSVNREDIEEFQIINIPLALRGLPEESFVACALALNLRTNVPDLPGPVNHLRALCYPQFGLVGASVAIIACPSGELRHVLKEVVRSARDLPCSPLGGPWAQDPDANRGSYLFSRPTESTVNDVIRTVQDLGFNQVELHGGRTFRFGDCQLDPAFYPNGIASLRATIERLHAVGIKVIMHPYAFFISKQSTWVTPVPDKRLAKDGVFTLAESVTADSSSIPVKEPTDRMSTITGFFTRNSVSIQVDNEIITYSGVNKEQPWGFTQCKRGALGTQATAHDKGSKVYHLKECFGLFAPDPDSTLFEEVAARNAELFNDADFDGIYLDALDGEDVLGGRENAWHYGSKYVFELAKRIKKPAIMEMSTFHHHLWTVRSRMGATDSPIRSYKRFIDAHVALNEKNGRMFLPSNLGWFAFRTWTGQQGESTYPDDIEYLCAKALGTDSGLSINYYNPETPAHRRLAEIVKRYEGLRHARYFDESIKKKLRVAGDEYTLVEGVPNEWHFKPIEYSKHKVTRIDDYSSTWKVKNRFATQPLIVRIEALMSMAAYDDNKNITLADFTENDLSLRASNSGVSFGFEAMPANGSPIDDGRRIWAYSTRPSPEAAWARAGKSFSPAIDLGQHQGLGIWVEGDGNGELINIQLKSPEHVSHAFGEHYIVVDFIGWRYFELVEPDVEQYSNYQWPYGGIYPLYIESLQYSAIESLSLWFNNLPPGKRVTCRLLPIKAIPLVTSKLINPTLTVNGRSIAFPVEIESGSYLEFRSMNDCKLYDPEGRVVQELKLDGEVPLIRKGDNKVEFTCVTPQGLSARAYITVINQGEVLRD